MPIPMSPLVPYLCALCDRVVRSPSDTGHDYALHAEKATER